MENKELENKVRRSVLIEKYQDDWLKQHPELNLSAFVRKKLDEEIFTHVRIVRITGHEKPYYKLGQRIRITKEEYANLEENTWGKYIRIGANKYYVVECKAKRGEAKN